MTTHHRRDARRHASAVRTDPAYQAFLLLRTVFTVAPIVFGLDKFFDVADRLGAATWRPRSTTWSRAPRTRRCSWSASSRSPPACSSRCGRASAATWSPPGWPASSSTCC